MSRLLSAALLAALAACEPSADQARPAALLSAPAPADVQKLDTVSDVMLPGVATDELPVPEPEPAPEPEPRHEADAYAYPEWNGYDLDCPDVGRIVRVTGDDPHRLDRDGDGWGCEKYGR